MKELINNFFADFINFYQATGAWIGIHLFALQLISLVICIILIYGIIYCIIKSHYLYYAIDDWRDYINVKSLPKIQSIRSWSSILKKLNKKDPESWKNAIEDSNKILEEILRLAGFKGKNLATVLDSLNPSQLKNLEEIKQAHQLCLQLTSGEREPEKQTIVRAINAYRIAFIDLGLLE